MFTQLFIRQLSNVFTYFSSCYLCTLANRLVLRIHDQSWLFCKKERKQEDLYSKNLITVLCTGGGFKQVRKNVINFQIRDHSIKTSFHLVGFTSSTVLFVNHPSLSKISLASSISRKSRANCSRDGHHRGYRLSACPAKYAYPSHLDAITKAIGIGKYLIRLVQREARLGRAETSGERRRRA